jgi:hypothetical protein
LREVLPRFAGKAFFAFLVFCFLRVFFFFRAAITYSFVSPGALRTISDRSHGHAIRKDMHMSCITRGGEVAAGRQ